MAATNKQAFGTSVEGTDSMPLEDEDLLVSLAKIKKDGSFKAMEGKVGQFKLTESLLIPEDENDTVILPDVSDAAEEDLTKRMLAGKIMGDLTPPTP